MTRRALQQILSAILMILVVLPMQAKTDTELQQALASFNQANYEGALRQLIALSKQQPNDSATTYYLARSYFRDGQLAQARKLLERNIARYPEDSESHFLLGSVKLTLVAEVNLFKKFGLARSALKSWQDAVALDAAHIEGQYALASFYTSAPGIIGGDLDKAREKVKQLGQLSEPYSLLVYASLNTRDKKFAEAEKLLLEAVASIPDRAFPTLILADFYFRRERYSDALQAIASYRKRDQTWNDPRESQTALLAGQVYAAQHNVEMARREYELAAKSKPSKSQLKLIRKGIDDL